MRHHKSGRKLGRDSAHRKALYANLASSLIEHGRIRTTEAKAKEVRPIVEQMITLGKRGDVAAHRQAVAFLRSKEIAHILFSEVAPRFAERLAARVRGELLLLDDCGHWWPYERPAEAAAALNRFWAAYP